VSSSWFILSTLLDIFFAFSQISKQVKIFSLLQNANCYVPYSWFIHPRVLQFRSRGSSDGIATRYGLDGPGIESRWGAKFSEPLQTGSEAHPASYTMRNGSFPRVKRPGCGVDHSLRLALRLKEEKGYTSIPILDLRGLF
jgi:hypothetical protein